MESLITRYRNVSILVAILFAQVLGLAVQVRRSSDNESSRLIRVWMVSAITPIEKGIVWMQSGVGNTWRNYVYLRGVRQENRDLKYELENLRLQQVRLTEDAGQARRLQALLLFKEQYISKTVAAQVIGFTGSDLSRAIYIDKGGNDGIRADMAVITSDGVVGKVLRIYNSTALILLINDQTSGVGAILEKSRLQGVLRGTPAGEVVLEKVLSDEQVQAGEMILTSGGDEIFPKGLPAGIVTSVSRGADAFLNIRVKPAAHLGRLEEVLVITQKQERVPVADQSAPVRAVDILAQRLPSVPEKPATPATQPGTAPAGSARPAGSQAPKPLGAAAATKPSAPKAAPPGSQTPAGEAGPEGAAQPGTPAPKPQTPENPPQ
jgi:rod shape-determining protein MreC